MMAGDDDLAARLPEPPPPAPLRRQAAIEEAMRRFDAAHGAGPIAETEPEPARREPWWTRLGRPQAAALVTAGLIVLFGVPAAWLSVSQHPMPASQGQLASADSVMAKRAAPGRLAEASPKPAAAEAPAAVAAPAINAPPVVAPAAPEPQQDVASPREEEARLAAATASTQPGRAQGVVAVAAESRVARTKQGYGAAGRDRLQLADAALPPPPDPMAAPASPPPPPPPPPPAVAAMEERYAYAPLASAGAAPQTAAKGSRGDIVVTSQRRAESLRGVPVSIAPAKRAKFKTVGRGDWNACTIEDPERSLQRCRRLIDPAAAGPKGQAAAHIADGLTRAWGGDLDGAIAKFDQAIAANPRNAMAYLNRGLALQRKGEFNRAGVDLDRAVRYAPDAARVYYNRSLLLRQRGEADRADADADRAVALDPDYVAVVK